MSLDVISEIEEAEAAAAKIRSDAKAEAAAAKKRASEEAAAAMKEKDEEAAAKRLEIIQQTKKETELLTFMAKGRMDTAARFIRERIVEG